LYDRWGEKIFESTDQQFCWDGKYKGELMNTQVLVYSLRAVTTSGNTITRKGNISLLR
jgi:gliding motility-associated-like protein